MMLRLFFLVVCYRSVNSELGQGFEVNGNGENETWKDLELSHRHRDPKYLLDRYPVGELPTDSADCRRPAKCIEMQHATCMGTRLPYTTTTMDLIPGHMTQDTIQEKLRLLQGVRHIPKCWAVVQPFLCSLFMPKCINDTVDLPSQEMCKMVSGPCRILFNHTIWPSFIRCENRKLFPRFCKNDIRELKFNTSGKCLKPLIPSDNNLAIFEGVEGCGVQCSDPLLTIDEQEQIHTIIAWGAGLSGTINFLTVVTFLMDWRSSNKYPAQGIFYINFCFMVSCFGWLAQFMGSREFIVCRKDGTPRINEPSGETLGCVAVFIAVYYSLMAAMVWFVIFTYAWHMSFQGLGKIQDRIDKKKAYFHLIAWCLPIVMTVAVITLGEIDGSSVTGICFVGYTNQYARAWFLHGPLLVVLAFGGYFLGRGLITLIYLKISSQEIISKRASKKIGDNIVRMILFSILTMIAAVVTFWCYVYEFQNSGEWRQSFRNYMICSITTKYAEESECKMDSRPSIAVLQIQVLAPFCTSVLMSSWVWRRSTLETWKRAFKRTFKCEYEEPVRLKKHKVIAQAFAKRKAFNNAGRLSISFRNTHDDPVGVNFNLDSVDSQDFSSAWAAALPKLVVRRDALVGGNASSVSSIRRNSGDSEISFSMRRVSVESRRNSIDSQISVQYAEVKATRKVPGSRGRRTKRRRDGGKSAKTSKLGPVLRRGSTTSQESQLGAQILSALTSGAVATIGHAPNMKRRSAIAGLDDKLLAKITDDKQNPGVLLPFLFPVCSDENLSSVEKLEANGGVKRKEKDLEAGTIEKDESESDDSQAEESTMIGDDSRPKITNKNAKSYHMTANKRSRERPKSKYSLTVQDETVLKRLLDDEDDDDHRETKAEEKKGPKDEYGKSRLGDLTTSLNEYCPELRRIMRTESEKNAREMSTQTSLPIDILEMEELKQSIDEIINSRNCSSKATQISPKMNKANGRRTDDTYR